MASKYIKKFPITGKLPHLLHDFAREVLRDQPQNIYDYGFEYFLAMEQGVEFEYDINKTKNVPKPEPRKKDDQIP
eukprot:CAMPEP_0176374376 /NCGR_PEP_ID=MMETSP0126-20121128/26713_1 /TAXON_ID=141414 ORGANISM="Strombidinopsis acuminatum, Strain SPMC142" /NCGR_SAMPLE_ID=MMETSP0126 /ASSEMBLY_ACC=CAM_ASM_000229 /LENGTH=74 /DNA_ID=CAMNT_0017734925 /DNA_START=18 /DNA_END=242 /DNA_ORIENTATION=+